MFKIMDMKKKIREHFLSMHSKTSISIKLTVFWPNACILHGTVTDFSLATLCSDKCIVNKYILIGKYTRQAIN